MTTISDIIHSTADRDERDTLLYAALGITAPGASIIREPDGRLMVWASASDAVDDDGARATYRSPAPITDADWSYVCRLAWVEEYDSV